MPLHHLRSVLICALCAIILMIGSASAASTAMIISRLNAHNFTFNGKSYAGKKAAMITIAECLLEDGYEPAYVAGVMANVACEGSFGKFENITGYTQTRLLEVFPKLLPCSESGKGHQNYIAHMNGFTTYDTCGHDHSEYAKYSKKYIYNGFSLKEIDSMLQRYAAESWQAKFGLGSMQWTGGRTATLFTYYKAEAGSADTITAEQCASAEMKMIRHELAGSYKYIRTNWLAANSDTATGDAAYDAGYRICYYYEVPANRATVSVTRGNIARDIYAAMVPDAQLDGEVDAVTDNGNGTVTIEGWFADTASTDIVYTIDIALNGTHATSVSANRPGNGSAIGHRFSATIDAVALSYVYGDTGIAVSARETGKTESYTVPFASGVPASFTLRFDRALILPASLTAVSAGSFSGNDAMYIRIPEGTHSIGSGAFANCSDLVRIDIPTSVTSIAADAFSGCDRLTIVCDAGSIAAAFAKSHSISYIIR